MRACQGTTSNLHNSQAAQPEESMDNTEYVNDEVETIGSQRMDEDLSFSAVTPNEPCTPSPSFETTSNCKRCQISAERVIQMRNNLRKCKQRNVKLTQQLRHQRRITEQIMKPQVCFIFFVCVYHCITILVSFTIV